MLTKPRERLRGRDASTLTITADCGGSNGNRTRLWKTKLQHLANQNRPVDPRLPLPARPSKWNKIEHRPFSFISQNWRGKPLISHEVSVILIGATTTRTGLEIFSRLEARSYPHTSRS